MRIPGRFRVATLSRIGAATVMLIAPAISARAAEQPRGLLLRKGMIAWQTTLAQARPLVEENVRPKTLQLLANAKPEGFGCGVAGSGVTRCVWACCVDLGERDTVHFATLSFYNDKFYAYDVKFNTNLFPRLAGALVARFGPPSNESQENRTNFAPMQGGVSTFVVNLKRWDVDDVAVLLFDRGAGGPLVGELYVAYRPLARLASPPKPQDEPPPLKLPF